MKKTKINVQKAINTIDNALDKLEKGIPNAKISKLGKQEIIKELEETIVLAESIKANIQKEKAKRA
ncbi:MAG: hypothetical protein AB8G86_09385 [Saprospiraceae bacterium]